MHHIGAGDAEGDGRVRRHQDALRREGVLLADRTHGDGAVGLERAAQIALDEFPAEMQRPRVDGLDAALRHGGLLQPGEDGHDHEQHEEHNRDTRPAVLDALDAIGALVLRGGKSRGDGLRHGAPARGTNTRR